MVNRVSSISDSGVPYQSGSWWASQWQCGSGWRCVLRCEIGTWSCWEMAGTRCTWRSCTRTPGWGWARRGCTNTTQGNPTHTHEKLVTPNWARMHARTHTSTRTHTHTRTHAHAHAHAHAYAHAHAQTRTRTRTRTHTHASTHTAAAITGRLEDACP